VRPPRPFTVEAPSGATTKKMQKHVRSLNTSNYINPKRLQNLNGPKYYMCTISQHLHSIADMTPLTCTTNQDSVQSCSRKYLNQHNK